MENYDVTYDKLTSAIQEILDNLDPNSDSYQEDVATLAKLYALRNEAEKIVVENNKIEYEDLRANKQRKLEIAKVIVQGVTAVGTAAIGVFEFVKMMDFETEGNFFRGFAGKLFSRERRKERELL